MFQYVSPTYTQYPINVIPIFFLICNRYWKNIITYIWGGETHKTFSVLPLELALINTEIVQLSEMVNIGIGCFEFCTESKKYDLDESPKGYA